MTDWNEPEPAVIFLIGLIILFGGLLIAALGMYYFKNQFVAYGGFFQGIVGLGIMIYDIIFTKPQKPGATK